MATIVYQGLRSCLESHLAEPRSLRLTLSSPKPHFSQPLELTLNSCFFDSTTKEAEEKRHDKRSPTNPDSGGWSFLQALSVSSQSQTTEKQNTYVHPMIKRSSSTLSERSLELCTENLGNETGSDITENSILSLSSSDEETGNSPTRRQPKSRQLLGSRKPNSRSFPPPLTTIRGTESLQVRPHREDGRLVIEAVKTPSTHSCFQAERSNGRLRLCILKSSCSSFDSEEVAIEENKGADRDNEREKFQNNMNRDEEEGAQSEEEEEEEEAEEMEDDEQNNAYFGKEIGCDSLKTGTEILQRPCRCKEGEHEKKGLLNWEPFWVATS